MNRADELAILGRDEMLDRAWQRFQEEAAMPELATPQLTAATVGMVERAFRAGWLSCLYQQMLSAVRSDSDG